MQVNPEDRPPKIYVTWSDPLMTDFENANSEAFPLCDDRITENDVS